MIGSCQITVFSLPHFCIILNLIFFELISNEFREEIFNVKPNSVFVFLKKYSLFAGFVSTTMNGLKGTGN